MKIMDEINIYKKRLTDLVNSYNKELPESIYGPNRERSALWSDIVWYFKDPDLGTFNRYIFTRSAQDGEKRLGGDAKFCDRDGIKDQLLSDEYDKLLKIYSIYIQSFNISNGQKRHHCLCGARLLTLADDVSGLNNISNKDWEKYDLSARFWDFCKAYKLISGTKRPRFTKEDRDRTAEAAFDQRSNALKMVTESKILALGEMFSKIFEDVMIDGRIKKDGKVDVKDAISISFALLGLAAPNWLQNFCYCQTRNLKRSSQKLEMLLTI